MEGGAQREAEGRSEAGARRLGAEGEPGASGAPPEAGVAPEARLEPVQKLLTLARVENEGARQWAKCPTNRNCQKSKHR